MTAKIPCYMQQQQGFSHPGKIKPLKTFINLGTMEWFLIFSAFVHDEGHLAPKCDRLIKGAAMIKMLKYSTLLAIMISLLACGEHSGTQSDLSSSTDYEFYYMNKSSCFEFNDVYADLFADIDYQEGQCPTMVSRAYNSGWEVQSRIARCFFKSWHLVKYYYQKDSRAKLSIPDAKDDCIRAGGVFLSLL